VRGAGTLIMGRIATLAGSRGPGWVEAIAVQGGRVVAAGGLAEVEAALAPGARCLRLAPDEVAIPGLTDAHLHLAEAALARRRATLDDARSIDDVIGRVRAAAAARPDAGAWIEGAGWDPDLVGRWPTADDLEVAAPGRLVALWAHDHHALLASAAALAADVPRVPDAIPESDLESDLESGTAGRGDPAEDE
jgi:predicted amidohydrolase YtcJ